VARRQVKPEPKPAARPVKSAPVVTKPEHLPAEKEIAQQKVTLPMGKPSFGVREPTATPATTVTLPMTKPGFAAREPAATPAATPVSRGVSLPFSKEDMTVTISGEQAWVQVSPTRTVTVRKGDVLPNLGKVIEIRKNEVVAEKGTLTTN
jgi:hypothetical protein